MIGVELFGLGVQINVQVKSGDHFTNIHGQRQLARPPWKVGEQSLDGTPSEREFAGKTRKELCFMRKGGKRWWRGASFGLELSKQLAAIADGFREQDREKMLAKGYVEVEITDSDDPDLPNGKHWIKPEDLDKIIEKEEEKTSEGGIFFHAKEFRRARRPDESSGEVPRGSG